MSKFRTLPVALLFGLGLGTAHAQCYDTSTVGSWKGGDVIADNSGGSDFRGDSGAVIMTGCSWLLGNSRRYYSNWSIGYRYQSSTAGQGKNTGWMTEASLGTNLGGVTFGVGGRVQFNSEVRDYYGKKTKLEPALGGFAYIGVVLGQGFELQYRQHRTTYESEAGEEFAGADYGVFLHRAF